MRVIISDAQSSKCSGGDNFGPLLLYWRTSSGTAMKNFAVQPFPLPRAFSVLAHTTSSSPFSLILTQSLAEGGHSCGSLCLPLLGVLGCSYPVALLRLPRQNVSRIWEGEEGRNSRGRGANESGLPLMGGGVSRAFCWLFLFPCPLVWDWCVESLGDCCRSAAYTGCLHSRELASKAGSSLGGTFPQAGLILMWGQRLFCITSRLAPAPARKYE